MNDYELLLSEYEKELTFKFDNNMPDGLPAIIIGKVVHINPNVPYQEAITYLAEEIGHHKTLAEGIDITDQSVLFNKKLELKGREWGYRKLVPKEKLVEFIAKRDSVMEYELAEEFDLPPEFINKVVEHYRVKGII